ncbi:hypothetical protein L3X38_029161 [Prunus dulcis]|uniref:Retrotransposon gag domain-containing protein n=1 Tax=Prunus dulcis TaxID=3755 RepID=A0AAD4VSQ2_PRUDU|nr:hypothetical protein L3X38_029161 [Prunus dulcis]
MCNSAGTNDDYLVKQFVRSLRGTAFNWYIDLEPESIDSWEQMEREFLNRFYSTRRSVSMLELTSTKQRKDEPVVDYINRWRSLSLDCKDRVSELSAVEMCIQGIPPLAGSKFYLFFAALGCGAYFLAPVGVEFNHY